MIITVCNILSGGEMYVLSFGFSIFTLGEYSFQH